MMKQILIVEDESDIAESLRYNFARAGFAARVARSDEEGLNFALEEENSPALILLDIMLPGMSGLELCRRLKREPLTRRTPIIMLTAKSGDDDKIIGLETGADDYVTKPFSIKEVMARVRSILRRTIDDDPAPPPYRDGNLSIDFESMRVFCKGREVKLTRKEFGLLRNLVQNSGRVSTRQNLLDSVWGYRYEGGARTLDVHVRGIRKKLGDCGNRIETVVGIGYRFDAGKTEN